MSIFSINAAQFYSCGHKDLKLKFTAVLQRQDNVKLKTQREIAIHEASKMVPVVAQCLEGTTRTSKKPQDGHILSAVPRGHREHINGVSIWSRPQLST